VKVTNLTTGKQCPRVADKLEIIYIALWNIVQREKIGKRNYSNCPLCARQRKAVKSRTP